MDAAGLATFGIAGTLVAVMMDIPPLLASFMGVLTGAMGGILRDVLCGEAPVVFNSQLYATVLWLGSLLCKSRKEPPPSPVVIAIIMTPNKSNFLNPAFKTPEADDTITASSVIQ
jgi:uncharacterized membrane protein YeiH